MRSATIRPWTARHVADASLEAHGLTISAAKGSAFSGVVAWFTDANPLAQPSDFAVSIDWGDGTTTAGSVAPSTGSGFDVVGTHAYGDVAAAAVKVLVRDQGGSTSAATSRATVSESGIVGRGAALSVGQAMAVVDAIVATFTDGNGVKPAADFTAEIDWGDGETSAGPFPCRTANIRSPVPTLTPNTASST